MGEIKKYFCEGCGLEFGDYQEYKKHDAVCEQKHLKFKVNVYDAIARIVKKYKSDGLIKDHSFKINDETEDYSTGLGVGTYKFEIIIKLTDGNVIKVHDGCDELLPLGAYVESNCIYEVIDKEIQHGFKTKYEGVLNWEYEEGWRTEKLGEIYLSNIVDRFKGRKVRIEAID
jgi:hypothetical protein